jgi:protein-tyrosine phosphatase
VTTSPTNRYYWVVPGKLAAGAYPNRHSVTSDDQIDVVEQLLRVGIGDFVNLTQDRPGGTESHLVRYDQAIIGRASVSRFEIPDFGIPTVEAMTAILDHIDRRLAAGLGVYVHCQAGVGRTGTVVGCWLIRHQLAESDNVFSVIKKRREGNQETPDHASPETEAQRQFVRAWRTGR